MDGDSLNEERTIISPTEVRGQAFRSALFGYRRGDVQLFLDELAENYGRLHEEKTLLDDRLKGLDDVVAEYRKLEETLQDTLVRAEQTAEDMVVVAKARAETIVEEARLEAKRLVDQAVQNAARIEREITELQRQRATLVAQMTAICRGQLALLGNLADESDVQGPSESGGMHSPALDAGDDEQNSEAE